MIYSFLDWFFVILHTLLIIFNLLGWIWKPFRKANLITLLLTGLSWTLLGIFYGIGYCPLTDWHWEVLSKLGEQPQTNTYVAYLFNRILGISFTDQFADIITLWSYLTALMLSLAVNIKPLLKSKGWKKRKLYPHS